jgi:hypothetical protein
MARRTESITLWWPAEESDAVTMECRGRDIVSKYSSMKVVDEARVVACLTDDRRVRSIETSPDRTGLAVSLCSANGRNWKSTLASLLPEDRDSGSLLFQLLDDLFSAHLLRNFPRVWWTSDEATTNDYDVQRHMSRAGVCVGFRPDSTALTPEGPLGWVDALRPAPPLERDDDPWGWHRLDDLPADSMRRVRRIDVRRVDGAVKIDSWFQDSAGSSVHGRMILHEYSVELTVDPATERVEEVRAFPRVLPYSECSSGADGVHHLVGIPVRSLRSRAERTIPVLESCTHLNDAARALADVPVLMAALEG